VLSTAGWHEMQFWANKQERCPVRWYRVPLDTPALPFPHYFLAPGMDGRLLGGKNRVGLEGLEFYVPPGDPGMPVGCHHKLIKYDKGTLPAGWHRPTRWIGTLRQWQQGSTVGRDRPLIFQGYCSTGCFPVTNPNAQACATGCEVAPLISPVWLMEDVDNFAGLSPVALVKQDGCVFSNAPVPDGTLANAPTAAAWQVVPDSDAGGVGPGVIAHTGVGQWGSCCGPRV
jgi:hypothetical protein